MNKGLIKEDACLLIIDVQEKLHPLVHKPAEMLDKLTTLIRGCRILSVPILISEQYPKGLGTTLSSILEEVGPDRSLVTKTAFSCVREPSFKKWSVLKKQWILAGIETHVCVFQTARDLLSLGKEVVIAQDAVTSRSLIDFSSGISEMRDLNIRISSVETILFDLAKDSSTAEFKPLISLFK